MQISHDADLREGESQKVNLCSMNYLRKCFSVKSQRNKKSFKYHNVDNLTNQYKYYFLNGRMAYCNSCGRLQLVLHFASNVVNISMIYSSF